MWLVSLNVSVSDLLNDSFLQANYLRCQVLASIKSYTRYRSAWSFNDNDFLHCLVWRTMWMHMIWPCRRSYSLWTFYRFAAFHMTIRIGYVLSPFELFSFRATFEFEQQGCQYWYWRRIEDDVGKGFFSEKWNHKARWNHSQQLQNGVENPIDSLAVFTDAYRGHQCKWYISSDEFDHAH